MNHVACLIWVLIMTWEFSAVPLPCISHFDSVPGRSSGLCRSFASSLICGGPFSAGMLSSIHLRTHRDGREPMGKMFYFF